MTRSTPDQVPAGRRHAAARGELAAATLAFARGATDVHLRPEPQTDLLFTATFAGRQPAVSTSGDCVRIRYRLGPNPRGRGDLSLNPEVSWAIRIDGGVAGLHGDLALVPVTSIDIRGGASEVTLRLPFPAASRVPIRIWGGASRVTILRPATANTRLHISRGAAQLVFDAQRFDAVGGDVHLASAADVAGARYYDIEVGSGARRLTVQTDDHTGNES